MGILFAALALVALAVASSTKGRAVAPPRSSPSPPSSPSGVQSAEKLTDADQDAMLRALATYGFDNAGPQAVAGTTASGQPSTRAQWARLHPFDASHVDPVLRAIVKGNRDLGEYVLVTKDGRFVGVTDAQSVSDFSHPSGPAWLFLEPGEIDKVALRAGVTLPSSTAPTGSSTPSALETPSGSIPELTQEAKVAIWKRISAYAPAYISEDIVYPGIDRLFTYGSPSTTINMAYVVTLYEADDIVVSPSSGYFAAVKDLTLLPALPTMSDWSLFLKPGEWRTISASAGPDYAPRVTG
jgi:hypothetical protein